MGEIEKIDMTVDHSDFLAIPRPKRPAKLPELFKVHNKVLGFSPDTLYFVVDLV